MIIDLELEQDAFVEVAPETGLSTSSKATFEKICRWRENCKSHSRCNHWLSLNSLPSRLPTRLLEVSRIGPNLRVRLVLSQGLDTDTRYITLSHCWGKSYSIRLVHGSFDDFTAGIPQDRLPKTFQDAVAVTLDLGFSYLWIDALCIIQDSKDDWIREASFMAATYANSTLNIAATDSKNGSEGLFRDRSSDAVSHTLLRLGDHVYLCYVSDWNEKVTKAPLNSRCWVLQERILAPRVVHFTATQVRWECAQLITSDHLPDDFHEDPDDYHVFQKSSLQSSGGTQVNDLSERYRSWYKIVEIFSRGHLSVPSDMPVAIAGLARIFCHHLGLKPEDYLCGLWRPRFVHQLAWTRWIPPKGKLEDYANSRSNLMLPFWSWLSMHTPCRTYDSSLRRAIAELLEVHTKPESDPFGPVRSASCKVKAPLCLAKLRTDENATAKDPITSIILGDDELFSRQHKFLVRLDDASDDHLRLVLDRPLYLSLLLTYGVAEPTASSPQSKGHPQYGGQGYECLILLPSECSIGFRRIGYLNFGVSFEARDGRTFGVREPVPSEMWNIVNRGFCSRSIAAHLCESADEKQMYTFSLV